MSGDRGLDIEVIKTVFGVKRVHCRYGQPWDEATAEHESDRPFYIPSGKPWRTHSIDAIPVPRYSQDIAAAWLVATRLVEQGYEVLVSNEADGWSCELAVSEEMFKSGQRGYISIKATAPEAICAAALGSLREAAVRGAGDGGAGQ